MRIANIDGRLSVVGPAYAADVEKTSRGFLDSEVQLGYERCDGQDGRTAQLIFDVPMLVERVSFITTLLPGDVILTGNPAGVGMGRTPQRWLTAGDTLTSSIDGIGEMRHRLVDVSGAR